MADNQNRGPRRRGRPPKQQSQNQQQQSPQQNQSKRKPGRPPKQQQPQTPVTEQEKLLAAQAELAAAWQRAEDTQQGRLPSKEFGVAPQNVQHQKQEHQQQQQQQRRQIPTERQKDGKTISYHAGGISRPQNAPQRNHAPQPAPVRPPEMQSAHILEEPRRRGRPPKETTGGRLKIIPLGGLLEVGKNITVYEFGEDIIVVDAGMAFPEEDMLGIDLVMPDVTYLVKNKHKIRGVFITHGHEDHIGAISYLLREMNPPVYATPFARGLVESKLEESGLLRKADLNTIRAGEAVKAGVFTVEAINVNHSTPDSVSYAITTPLGVVIQTGDFKIDSTPVGGEMIDLARFGEYGRRGVLCLLSDSTNVERPGYTMSERTVGETFDNLFRGSNQRLLVTTFASNVHRIQQIIESAVKVGRKVAISGRSMEKVLALAVKLGYINIPNGTLLDMAQINSVPADKLVIITTGSQGETMSALYRMAFGTHKQVQIGAGDKVILSASPIPGNENSISRVVNELLRRGADVVYERLNALHVSGHACQEELKIILGLVKPRYFMPVHGEYKMLRAHGRLAALMGVSPKNIFLSENGRILEITQHGAKLQGSVQAGAVLLDGSSSEDVGGVVLRDRQLLAEDGVVLIAMTIDRQGNLVAGPQVVSRGFVYAKESDGTINGVEAAARTAYEAAVNNGRTDRSSVKNAVRAATSDHIYKTMKRRPMVLPVILEVGE